MKLKKLIAENVKGRDFAFELKNVNIFAGDSFSGKTAILDAVRVGLLGYHPQLLKTHKSTMDLAGGKRDSMMIALETEQGVISREWKRKNEDEVTVKMDCPIGEIPEVLLDTKSYFEQTAAERIAFVFERIVMNDIGISDQDFLAKLKTIEALPVNELPGGLEELEKVFTRSVNVRNNKKQTPQLWLSDLIDLIKTEKKRFDQLAKEKAAAMVALRHLGPTPKQLTADIEKKEQELAPIRATQAKYKAAEDLRNQQGPRRSQLEAIIRNASLDTTALVKNAGEIEQWLQQYPSYSEATRNALEAKRAEARAQQQKIKDLGLTIGCAKTEIAELNSREDCPYCKTKTDGWRQTVLKKISQSIIDNELALETERKTLERIVNEGKQLALTLEEAEKFDTTRTETQSALDQINLQLREAEAARMQVELARAELSGMVQNDIPDPATIANNQAMMDRLEEELRSLHEQNAAYDNFMSNKKTLNEKEREKIRCETRSNIFQKAIKMIVAEQDRVVKEAFDTLLLPCRQFTDGILRGPVTYRDGRLGMDMGEEWVPQTVLSGTEHAVIYAGLSVALAQQSPIKIVLIDELGIMDSKTKLAVVKRMDELAVKGFIDNFFGCDTRPADYKNVKSQNFQLIPV